MKTEFLSIAQVRSLSAPFGSRRHDSLPRTLRSYLMGLMVMCLGALPVTSFAETPVNINLATAESLAEALEGVGLAKAYRIIEYREAYGPFEQIEELASVQGIGQATIDKNRDVIRLQ